LDTPTVIHRLRVLTVNTHKGFTALNRRFILPELRDAVRSTSADLVFLQEVVGEHERHSSRYNNWPQMSQYEFLADSMWSDFAYGRNAVYPDVHAICVHLSLLESHRQLQLQLLCQLLESLPDEAPVIIAGDFNDWQLQGNVALSRRDYLHEAFERHHGRPAKTYPARFPLLRLDRIYLRNASSHEPKILGHKPWTHLSDHLPLAVEVHL
jgi:endonuclease/exonuclease/phosphatase family metal-dependent hydrolase